MADVIVHDETRTAEPGEFVAYLDQKSGKTATPVAVAEPEPAPAEDSAPVEPPAQPWEDPETHTPIEKPTRGDKRIKRLWTEREQERQRANRLEAELATLRQTPAPAAATSAPTAVSPTGTAAPDELTAAAQARIRSRPDRAQIGNTYPTYEDYVEDCAVWGGELAAEKRSLQAERQAQTTTAQQHQAAFAADVAAAKPEYPDFDAVVTNDLPINDAIWRATVSAPDGLKGHVLYYLGTHAEQTRSIAQMAPEAALIAMGEVIATVRQARAEKAAPVVPRETKPKSRAPAPLQPAGRNGGAPTQPDQIAEAGGNPVDYIRMRNEQTRRRY